jgi:hypothetical protein
VLKIKDTIKLHALSSSPPALSPIIAVTVSDQEVQTPKIFIGSN